MPHSDLEETWSCSQCKSRNVPWNVRHFGVEAGREIRCVAVRIELYRLADGTFASRSKVLKSD